MLEFEQKKLGDGASEIGVRHKDTKQLVAVITHPCQSAKWFLHFMSQTKTMKFESMKSAKIAVKTLIS